jgi:hypothetical protein
MIVFIRYLFGSTFFKGLARETGRVDLRAAGLTGRGLLLVRMLRTPGFPSQEER